MIYRAGNFVQDLATYFTPPRGWTEDQAQGWGKRLEREISHFQPDALKKAADQIIAKRKDTRLPTIADCIAACAEAKRWLDIERGKSQLPFEGMQSAGEGDWSAERVRLAYDLIHSELGKQAARGGWVFGLWNFCRVNQRHPKEMEIEKLKKQAAKHRKLVEDCHRGNGGKLSAALATIGESMIAKGEVMAAAVLSGKRA